jgi:hypothetical protein
MSSDPLAQYRKTPPAPPSAGTQKGPEEYVAFAGKDKPLYLEIRRAMAPTRSPRNTLLLDVSFDGPFGTNFVLSYTFMVVLVRGKNLQEMIFAIQNNMAAYIQEFDPDRWGTPKNEKAAFIESIEVHMVGGNPENQSESQTKH